MAQTRHVKKSEKIFFYKWSTNISFYYVQIEYIKKFIVITSYCGFSNAKLTVYSSLIGFL